MDTDEIGVRMRVEMKISRIFLPLMLLLLPSDSGSGWAQNREIQDHEAASHIGEFVTVRGVVANVHTSRAGNTFINFGRPYPNQAFTAVIFKERTRLFPNVHGLEGNEVLVTGEVRLYKGKPEIILRDPSQLKRASSH